MEVSEELISPVGARSDSRSAIILGTFLRSVILLACIRRVGSHAGGQKETQSSPPGDLAVVRSAVVLTTARRSPASPTWCWPIPASNPPPHCAALTRSRATHSRAESRPNGRRQRTACWRQRKQGRARASRPNANGRIGALGQRYPPCAPRLASWTRCGSYSTAQHVARRASFTTVQHTVVRVNSLIIPGCARRVRMPSVWPS